MVYAKAVSWRQKNPYTRPTAQTPEETGSVPVKENIATSAGITVALRSAIPFMS
jgi:hypothetical protein